MSWLVLNTGSSSLKFALYDPEVRAAAVKGSINWQGDQARLTIQVGDGSKVENQANVSSPGAAAAFAIRVVLDTGITTDPIQGVGHRIVHGGTRFQESVRINSEVEADIQSLT